MEGECSVKIYKVVSVWVVEIRFCLGNRIKLMC